MATWEISWEDQLPPVRYQGQRPSCSFEAMLYSGKVINANNIRRGVLVPAEVTTFHHDSFVADFELSTGTLLGDPWNNYNDVLVPTALNIFRDRGVAAVPSTSYYGYTPVRISDYQAHARLSFRQVQHYVERRHPVLGSFYVRPNFGYLPAGMIYQLQSPPNWWDEIHMVMFCGCGKYVGRPYLVYLNAFGWWWGQLGVGRVFWDQVLQITGTQHVLYTMEMDGVIVPPLPIVPPPLPIPASPPHSPPPPDVPYPSPAPQPQGSPPRQGSSATAASNGFSSVTNQSTRQTQEDKTSDCQHQQIHGGGSVPQPAETSPGDDIKEHSLSSRKGLADTQISKDSLEADEELPKQRTEARKKAKKTPRLDYKDIKEHPLSSRKRLADTQISKDSPEADEELLKRGTEVRKKAKMPPHLDYKDIKEP